jgi:hypothetical protein
MPENVACREERRKLPLYCFVRAALCHNLFAGFAGAFLAVSPMQVFAQTPAQTAAVNHSAQTASVRYSLTVTVHDENGVAVPSARLLLYLNRHRAGARSGSGYRVAARSLPSAWSKLSTQLRCSQRSMRSI